MKKFLSIVMVTLFAFVVYSCNSGQSDKTKKSCGKEQTAEKCCGASDSCCKEQATEKCCASDSCCKKDRKIVITAYVEIKTDKVDKFLSETKDVLDKSKAEEGNLSYNLYADLKEKNKFVFVEEWKSQAAVDTHFATEHFKKFGVLLEEVAASPASIKIFAVENEK